MRQPATPAPDEAEILKRTLLPYQKQRRSDTLVRMDSQQFTVPLDWPYTTVLSETI